MKEKEDSVFKVLNTRKNKSFNNDNDNLDIDDIGEGKRHLMLK